MPMPMHSKTPDSMKKCSGPECSGCSSPECMSKGGMAETGYEKGINKGRKLENGKSYAGAQARGEVYIGQSKKENESDSKESHRKTLSEMKSMKKPNLYAEGGEVEGPEAPTEGEDMDSELHEALGAEILDAFERKDKKAIMSGIEAAVLSVMSKGEDV